MTVSRAATARIYAIPTSASKRPVARGQVSTIWKPNVTVAAIVARAGRFLLVEERTSEGIRINQPAGHLDPGETLLEGVVREALEETACRFVPTHLLGVYMARTRSSRGADVTYVRFAFVGEASEPEPGRALDRGILRALWLTQEELSSRSAAHRSPLVMRCIEDFQRGQRFPLETIYTHTSVTARP